MAVRLDPEAEEERYEFYQAMTQKVARISDAYADQYARFCASIDGLPAADQIELLKQEIDRIDGDLPY